VGSDRAAKEAVNLASLLQSYESVGHLVADIDPLKLKEVYKDTKTFAQKFRFPQADLLKLLDYREYGFTEADLDREFYIEIGHKSSILAQKKIWKLKDVIQAYKTAYCGKVGVEFSHIPDREICDWIRVNFEGIQFNRMTDDEKIHLYDRLNWSHDFGQFIGVKFNTMKRFGLEGCESFIPGLKVAIDAAVENGGRTFIIGMPHRGRLNVLTNVVRKPLEVIMAEFQGVRPNEEHSTKYAGSGDVKYHLGTTLRRAQQTQVGEKVEVTVTLLANPSHLECVNPVVMGRARAE
jgi:2-oxoglutarate dehydrogenase E1 component